MKWQVWGATLLALGVAVTTPPAHAQKVVEGVRFDSTLDLGGQRLQLNGAGVRKRMVFDVYTAGLYVAQPGQDAEKLAAQGGAKRVALRFLREVDSELFVTSLHNGLKANHREDQLAKWRPQVESLTATIKTIALARRGDSINFDYIPAEGIRVTVNGATRGPVIQGEDFYSAVLRVWIGEKPADEGLKKGIVNG